MKKMKVARTLVALFGMVAFAADYSPEKSIGSKNAPLLLDLYTDFQCPFCKRFHDQTLPDVIANYGNKGKAQMIFRDFPMPGHKYARDAARWANAAVRVHKYREVGDALFRTQEQWGESGDIRSAVATALTPAELKTVEALVKDSSFEDGVASDIRMGTAAGIRSMPTTIVTHKLQTYPFAGAVSYSIFHQALDDIAKK